MFFVDGLPPFIPLLKFDLEGVSLRLLGISDTLLLHLMGKRITQELFIFLICKALCFTMLLLFIGVMLFTYTKGIVRRSFFNGSWVFFDDDGSFSGYRNAIFVFMYSCSILDSRIDRTNGLRH